MKRIFLSLATLLFSTIFLVGQQKEPFMVFDSESYDFGTIKEEAGNAVHKFNFTNTGSMPLIIKDVKASCGCTTPDWTKDPVLPGNKGFISASYGAAGRPGPFNKTVTVTSNASNNPVTLRFNGTVTPKQKSPEEIYSTILDSIRMKSNFVLFDTLFFGKTKTKKIEIWNVRKSNATISFTDLPKYIKVKITPSTLKPDEKGIIEITYNAKLKNDWGYVMDNLQFIVNGKPNTNYKISVSADIKEDFSILTPGELEKAPKVTVSEHTFEFGSVNRGTEVKHDFIMKNEGLSDLIIRKKTSSCGCTVAEFKKMVLKPGESETISVTLNTTTKSGDLTTTITLITNDPKNSKVILFMRGSVADPKTTEVK